MNQKVSNLSELENDYDVVFNCTGMGSKYLCDDRHMVPIRGQLIKVYILTKLYLVKLIRVKLLLVVKQV